MQFPCNFLDALSIACQVFWGKVGVPQHGMIGPPAAQLHETAQAGSGHDVPACPGVANVVPRQWLDPRPPLRGVPTGVARPDVRCAVLLCSTREHPRVPRHPLRALLQQDVHRVSVERCADGLLRLRLPPLDAIEALEQEQAAIQTVLAGEAKTRADVDEALSTRIDAERIARQADDEALTGRAARSFGKNRMINGSFDFWQRGTSFPAAATARYTADRWQAWGAGSTLHVVRQAMDGIVLPNAAQQQGKPRYAAIVVVGSVVAANNFAPCQHQVEDVRTLWWQGDLQRWVYCAQS